MKQRSYALALGLLSMLALPTRAAEQVLVAPPGWTFEGNAYSATSTAAAAVAYKYKTGDASNVYDRSLVVISAAGGPTPTSEFLGKVFYLAYDPNGQHLLASVVGAPGMQANAIKSYLLDQQGQVLWSKEDSRMLFFSTNGQAVFAWQKAEGFGGGGDIAIYDLAGELLHTVQFGTSLQGVVVVDSGQEVILLTERSIMRFTSLDKIESVWRIDLPEQYPSIKKVSVADSRLVVELEGAATILVSLDGGLEYTYDPKALAETHPARTAFDYADATPIGAQDTTVSILDKQHSTVSLYNIATAAPVAQCTVDVPTGFTLLPRPSGKRLFLFSPGEIRVRE